MNILLAVVFLLVLAMQIIFNRYRKAGIGEAPIFYTSVIAQFIGNIATLLALVLLVLIFFFYGWKFGLIVLVIAFATEALIIVPMVQNVVEKLIMRFLSEKN